MAVSPALAPPVRRRRRRVGALVAAAAYAGAAYAAVAIVQSALAERDGEAVGVAAGPVAPPLTDTVGVRSAADRLALRTRAARAQQSVFRLEAANGATGSAFAAWTDDARTYLLTSRSLVARALSDGDRRVFLRRGERVWGGRVWAVHGDSGLAVVWVQGLLAQPLWQQPRRSERLAVDAPAVVVPGGPASPIGEGMLLSLEAKRGVVSAPADELAVGAPVLAANGRIAGVVVSADGRTHRVVAVERACARVRACA